ncbi:MAG TPA: hypothetical protein VNP92_32990 [Actinophytocola sp.]|nr:hypothetical protein [Actinophytocola sp.]
MVIGYQVLGDPTLWTWIGLPVLALALPLLLAATQRLEVDPHTGTFSSRNLWFWRRSVTVSADPVVSTVDAANGTAGPVSAGRPAGQPHRHAPPRPGSTPRQAAMIRAAAPSPP